MIGRVWRGMGALVLVTAVAGVTGVVPTRPAGAATAQVGLAKMRFNPARLQIQMGDTVVWEAGDDNHTVTARDGTFDSSTRGTMDAGDQFRWRFRTPGTYAYYCRVHQSRGMQGEIVVVDPYAATSTTRLTPVTAAATTSTTAAATTATTLPVTTTSRPLATSSTTSLKQITSTTVPVGTPAMPQEPPALNPNAPVLTGSGTVVLPEAQAAARREAAGNNDLNPAIALGVVGGVLLAAGGGAALRLRGHRRRRPPG
jgi:plastocyanin